jgi:hypothetical protein
MANENPNGMFALLNFIFSPVVNFFRTHSYNQIDAQSDLTEKKQETDTKSVILTDQENTPAAPQLDENKYVIHQDVEWSTVDWGVFDEHTVTLAENVSMQDQCIKEIEKNPLLVALLFWEGIRMTEKEEDFPEVREPGYFLSLVVTFVQRLTQMKLDESLTASFIERLHGDCTHNVKNTNPGNHYAFSDHTRTGMENSFSTKFRQEDLQSHLEHQKFIDRCVEHLATQRPHLKFSNSNMVRCCEIPLMQVTDWKQHDDTKSPTIRYLNQESKEVNTAIVHMIIQDYEDAIRLEKDERSKISIISTMIQRFERLHAFTDGNCRTFCMALLNLELIKHGLSPTLQDNPNDFDQLSLDPLVDRIIDGQERFRQLAACSHKEDFVKALARLEFRDLENQGHRVTPKWVTLLIALTLDESILLELSVQKEKRILTAEMLENAVMSKNESTITYLLSNKVEPTFAMIKNAIDLGLSSTLIQALIKQTAITAQILEDANLEKDKPLLLALLSAPKLFTTRQIWLYAIRSLEDSELLKYSFSYLFLQDIFETAIKSKKYQLANKLCPQCEFNKSSLASCIKDRNSVSATQKEQLDILIESLVILAIKEDKFRSVAQLITNESIMPSAFMLSTILANNNLKAAKVLVAKLPLETLEQFLQKEFSKESPSARSELLDIKNIVLLQQILYKIKEVNKISFEQMMQRGEQFCSHYGHNNAVFMALRLQSNQEDLQDTLNQHNEIKKRVGETINTAPESYPNLYTGCCKNNTLCVQGKTLVVFMDKSFRTEDIANILTESAQIGIDTLEFRMQYTSDLRKQLIVRDFIDQLNTHGATIQHIVISPNMQPRELDFLSNFAIEAAASLKTHAQNLRSLKIAVNDKGAVAFADAVQEVRKEFNVLETFDIHPITQWNSKTDDYLQEKLLLSQTSHLTPKLFSQHSSAPYSNPDHKKSHF